MCSHSPTWRSAARLIYRKLRLRLSCGSVRRYGTSVFTAISLFVGSFRFVADGNYSSGMDDDNDTDFSPRDAKGRPWRTDRYDNWRQCWQTMLIGTRFMFRKLKWALCVSVRHKKAACLYQTINVVSTFCLKGVVFWWHGSLWKSSGATASRSGKIHVDLMKKKITTFDQCFAIYLGNCRPTR